VVVREAHAKLTVQIGLVPRVCVVERGDDVAERVDQRTLVRSILRDHVACFAAIAFMVVLQVAIARGT
jgi:hypothetical protein